MTTWNTIDTAPEGIEVETKIDDERGVRNVQTMTRSGNRWFISSSMYAYYTPTHWRHVADEAKAEAMVMP